jgi:Icc protein
MKIRLAQITDLHIGPPDTIKFDAHPRAQFLATLKHAIDQKPDYIILSGDLCVDHGDLEIYQWIRRHLESCGIPYFLLPGNHDETSLMADVFDMKEVLHGSEIYYEKYFKPYHILFLDSSRGRFTIKQWQWLHDRILESNAPLLIFVHHPPVFAGVPHMDQNYAFIEQAEFVKAIKDHKHPVHIFCGHYHVGKTVHHANFTISITPSTLFQLDDSHEGFKLFHTQPGYRIIDLLDDRIYTRIKWLSG